MLRKALVPGLLTVVMIGAVTPNATAAEKQRYIVVLKDSTAGPGAVARQHAAQRGANVTHIYRHAIKGYAASMSEQAAAKVADDARVAFVEVDQRVTLFSQEVPTGVQRAFATSNPNIDIDGMDDVRVDVDVAVIDTGIDYRHPDLHVVARTNCAKGGPFNQSCTENDGDDGNGHGTHVAGTIGALDNEIGVVGMAPGARLWAVRVLDNSGSGYISWIVAGIDWVTARANQIDVANMSLGCKCSSSALDDAITRSVNAGVVHVVAAGNSGADAKDFSPANHPDVVTVSALADFNGLAGGGAAPTCRSDEDDTLASFSNRGSLINIAAPGVCILSTWKGGGYHTISGTSMASPHAAGAAALLASGPGDPTNRTEALAIRNTLTQTGNLNWTDDSGDGVKERLLDVSNTTTFAPAMVPMNGGGGGGEGGGDTPASPWNLAATGYKVKGLKQVDLTWNSGASSTTSVDVYRDGVRVETTPNDGAHSDGPLGKGGGTHTYTLCAAGGTTNCSNEATVSF